MPHKTFPKDPKGTFKAERGAKQRSVEREERRRKAAAKTRDGFRCRWPGCPCHRRMSVDVEAAHLTHKGSGGDPQLLRTTVETLITLCPARHRGTPSLDGGQLSIVPLTPDVASGPCEYFVGQRLYARERALHDAEIFFTLKV